MPGQESKTKSTSHRGVAWWAGLALILLAAASCGGTDSFHGTTLDSSDLAPPFELRDQFGDPVALSDMVGKVVVLTFLYTRCPDVCPLTTETLRRTHVLLGDDASRVNMLAISVDPQRDSIERVYEYSEEKDMLGRWHFLVGSEEELEPVWTAYWLDPIQGDQAHDDLGEEVAAATESDTAVEPAPEGYLVSHTAPVFLIDRDGYRRVVFTNLSLDPQPLVHDVRLLLR